MEWDTPTESVRDGGHARAADEPEAGDNPHQPKRRGKRTPRGPVATHEDTLNKLVQGVKISMCPRLTASPL